MASRFFSLLKRPYRCIFDSYLKWSDVTFIGPINRKIELFFGNDKEGLLSINLPYTLKFFRKNRAETGTDSGVEKVILVEVRHADAKTALNINLMQLLLSSKYRSNVIGYSSLKDPIFEGINRNFGVDKFVYNYKFFQPKVLALSIIATFKFIIKGAKFTKFVNPIVIVDKVDIGEHIYDNFLRKELLATNRKLSVKYLLYVYRGCYYYYRSKYILKNKGVTDIIVNAMVYTNAILMKAAVNLNREITIWNTEIFSVDKFSVSKVSSLNCVNEIPNNRIVKLKYIEIMKSYLNKKNIDKVFENYYKRPVWITKEDCAVDIDISYDKSRKNIFIFSHAFNDAIRYANNIIFSDYYIWLEETLEILSSNNNINIFIKPHPDEHKYHYKKKAIYIYDNLNSRNTEANIYFADNLTNDSIFSIADAIITVCGTIGIEAPCFGIPVMSASKTYYDEVKITVNSHNFEEYKQNLMQIHRLKKLSNEKRYMAKLTYLFINAIRYIDMGFDLDNHLFHDPKRDAKRYTLIDIFFKDLKPIKQTYLYNRFLNMLDNDFDEMINLNTLEKWQTDNNKESLQNV
jgi:hypothetical protein